MASKRHQRKKACEGKRRFPDFAAALQACYQYKRTFGHYMRAYPCHFCGAFHIGHPPKRILRALVDQRGF